MALVLVFLALGASLAAIALFGDASPIVVVAPIEARVVFGLLGAWSVAEAVDLVRRARARPQAADLTPAELEEVNRRARPRARRIGLLAVLGAASLLGSALVSGLAPQPGIRTSVLGTVLFCIVGFVLLLAGLLFLWNPARTLRENRLRSGDGIRGRATIRQVRESPISTGDAPLVDLVLDVEPAGRAPFRSKRDAERVPVSGLGRLTVGTSLPVVADPEDTTRFVILWEQP